MSSLRLEVASGASAGRVFDAELDSVRIGRAASNDLVLTDALISSEHARIVSSVDGFVLEDLGSTNGTWLLRAGEQHALGEGRRAIALSPGDRLRLGGPDSEGVLRLLMELGAEPVLGNHDLHWLQKGKPKDDRQRHWLESQPIVRFFVAVGAVLNLYKPLHSTIPPESRTTLTGGEK